MFAVRFRVWRRDLAIGACAEIVCCIDAGMKGRREAYWDSRGGSGEGTRGRGPVADKVYVS